MARDPALARTAAGETIDGRRLLAQSVRFGRALRAEGLGTDLGAAIDFARALTLVEMSEREQVRAAGAAVFVRRRDDRQVYDRVFDRFWRVRAWHAPAEMGPSIRPEDAIPGEDGDGGGAEAGDNRLQAVEDLLGTALAAPNGEDAAEEGEIDGVIVSPDAFSPTELLRHREFERMTPAELREAERLVDLLEPRLERRRTRRHELHRHGRLLAPRTMFRRNLATGGQMTEWVWRRRVRRPRPLVVLCDISGSMERHSRLLLRFIQALSASSAVRTESFVFGTRLTRVTRLLRDRDRDRALSRVSIAVNDWAGGTRIGESFRQFNLHWARRTLRSSGIVIVVSDGWDRGDPALVATETARLRRNCHRLIWLNPLAGTPGYQPLAAGMKAAYPFIDDFLPAGTIASLERLGELLAGTRPAENRLSGEAAASVTSAGVRAVGVPATIEPGAGDASAARPLTR